MAWVDLEYYKEKYLFGDAPLIPDKSFPRWINEAEIFINWRKVTVENPTDKLKNCVCEVAEYLYKNKDNPNVVTEADIYPIKSKHLSMTEYHGDFIYRGIG